MNFEPLKKYIIFITDLIRKENFNEIKLNKIYKKNNNKISYELMRDLDNYHNELMLQWHKKDLLRIINKYGYEKNELI